MNNLGWVSLHRQIMNNWIWENKPFAYGQAFIDMVLMANHKDNEMLFEGKIIIVKRGSFHTSILKLSERYGWNRKKTTNFINLLEKQKMVTTNRTTHGTTITIVNYDKYQDIGTTKVITSVAAEGATMGQPWDTNNNVNNDNNVNNNIISSEPDKPTPNPSGILLPLNDKTYYNVPLDKIKLWEEVYPAVDVGVELRRMIAWLDSNPKKKKTRRGIERFINSWLVRTQDSGGTKGKESEMTSGGNTYNSDQNWEDIKRAIAKATEGKEPWENIFA